MTHIDNLDTLLQRGALHAPSTAPADGLLYRSIHDANVQKNRSVVPIPCGPGGTCSDYVSFYFGERSPMLYRIATGWVDGYKGGERPIVYLVSTAQIIESMNLRFVFSDGHSLASYTGWFDDLSQLDQVDWATVKARQWANTPADNNRQTKKQAEFLVHDFVPWTAIHWIFVREAAVKDDVDRVLNVYPLPQPVQVIVRRDWFYF